MVFCDGSVLIRSIVFKVRRLIAPGVVDRILAASANVCAACFSPSASALWAMNYAQSVSSLQLWLVLPYGVISVVLLVALWKYMELD